MANWYWKGTDSDDFVVAKETPNISLAPRYRGGGTMQKVEIGDLAVRLLEIDESGDRVLIEIVGPNVRAQCWLSPGDHLSFGEKAGEVLISGTPWE